MAAGKIRPAAYALMVVVAVATTSQLASAQWQQGGPNCVTELGGCFSYLNSTSTAPDPQTCCSPLKEMVYYNVELTCLCQLFKDTQAFEQLHIDRDRALGLPEKCGASFSLAGCSADHSPPAPSDHAPPPGDLAAASAPAVAPSPTAGDLKEGGRIAGAASTTGSAWTGLPGVMIFYLIMWSVLA